MYKRITNFNWRWKNQYGHGLTHKAKKHLSKKLIQYYKIYKRKFKKFIYILSFDYVRLGRRGRHPLHIEIRYETATEIPRKDIDKFNNISGRLLKASYKKQMTNSEMYSSANITPEENKFYDRIRIKKFDYAEEREYDFPLGSCELTIKGVEIEKANYKVEDKTEVLKWKHEYQRV